MESEKEDIQLPADLDRLSSLVFERPEKFVSGDEAIRNAALDATKYIFDLTLGDETVSRPFVTELLDSIDPTHAPRTRSQARAAARGGAPARKTINHAFVQPTPLTSLFVTGMDDDQIWAQLDLKAKNVCETLEDAFDAGDVDARGTRDVDEDDQQEEDELDSDELDELEGLEGMDIDGQDWELDDSEDAEEEEEEGNESEEDEEDDEEEFGEGVAGLREESSDDSDEEDLEEGSAMDLDATSGPSSRKPSAARRGKQHAELDDGFFNLAEFNAETEEAESRSVSRGALSKDSDDDDSEGEENVDLFARIEDGEAFEEEDMEENTREARYKDFFVAPRAAKGKGKAAPIKRENTKVRFHEEVKVKTIKQRGAGLKVSMAGSFSGANLDDEEEDEGADDYQLESDEDEDEDIADESGESDEGREAVERLKDDLFADDEDDTVPKSGISTHEARMAELRKQIAALEEENVAEKDWVLKGEVGSRARPQNALLEEDLEFERVMKPVPVVSEEVVQNLEARIKARILEGRYDDVVRKRPVDDKPFLPSRFFELQDSKSKESLAQIYENEFVAAQAGGTSDDRDGKLQKEHEEIEKLWESISYKLDALCNAHFTPKQPKATISTVSNISAISLESALPTAKAATTVLAPEEVFTPSASDLRSKGELTPAEKQALRAKERKKKAKQRQTLEKSVDKFAKMKGIKGVKKQKEVALKSIVKNGKGVSVIGKKMERTKKSAKS